MWIWLEYYKDSNNRNSQFHTKTIWWKPVVIIKPCKFPSHTNQFKLSVMEILLPDVPASSLFPRLWFCCAICYCPIQQTVLNDFFWRAGSSTCSFDLKKKAKQSPSTKYFNQTDFSLALDTFCVPTPWIWRTRCKMPWPPSFSRAPAKTLFFTKCCNSPLGAESGVWILSARFPDEIISRFYKLWGFDSTDQVYSWWIECESICEPNPHDGFFLLLCFFLS